MRSPLVLAAFTTLAIACTSFGASDNAPTGPAATSDAGSTSGFCDRINASAAPPTACDDFDQSNTIPSRWKPQHARNGSAAIQSSGSSKPNSVVLLGSAGASCSGSSSALGLQVSAQGRVRVLAKLNIDDEKGQATPITGNGGPAVAFATNLGSELGGCTFYIDWQEGLPELAVDHVPLTGAPQFYFKHIPLKTTAIASGEWLDVDITLEPSATGTRYQVKAGGKDLPPDTVTECTYTLVQEVNLSARCAETLPIRMSIDDFALYLP